LRVGLGACETGGDVEEQGDRTDGKESETELG